MCLCLVTVRDKAFRLQDVFGRDGVALCSFVNFMKERKVWPEWEEPFAGTILEIMTDLHSISSGEAP